MGSPLVFYANGALRRLPVAGGVPVIVCETDGAPFGIQWS